MRRRAAMMIAAVALALIVCAWPAAIAKDLGTDVIGNISPRSQLDSGALVDRYPLSAFSLDYHTDVGITELDGVPPTIAHWSAAQLWSLTSFLIKTVIGLFTWAFSLDLLGVDPDRPEHGALAPVSQAITSIYDNVLGQAWMAAAIVLAGIWGIWKALVQRRYTETVGGLAVSVLFVLIALFFVYQPQNTVGTASRWTNDMSLAFLSGANRGSLDDPAQAKRDVADQLFDTLIYRPWVVLQFGGLRHCVDTDRRDDDGYPRPVAHTTAAATSAATISSKAATATAATPSGFCATPRAQASGKPSTTRCARAASQATTHAANFAPTRSTRPTHPRSTSSKKTAPTSA